MREGLCVPVGLCSIQCRTECTTESSTESSIESSTACIGTLVVLLNVILLNFSYFCILDLVFKSLEIHTVHGRKIFHTWEECEKLIQSGAVKPGLVMKIVAIQNIRVAIRFTTLIKPNELVLKKPNEFVLQLASPLKPAFQLIVKWLSGSTS